MNRISPPPLNGNVPLHRCAAATLGWCLRVGLRRMGGLPARIEGPARHPHWTGMRDGPWIVTNLVGNGVLYRQTDVNGDLFGAQRFVVASRRFVRQWILKPAEIALIKQAQQKTTLVRYGRIPEVARFNPPNDTEIARGELVVVETHRGIMLGEFLEEIPDSDPEAERSTIVRKASDADKKADAANRTKVEQSFGDWCDRIEKWNLDLQLVDLEWTLDGEKLIFYVLNERGPDCTKLALQAAAGGFGIIEVQPVDGGGLVELPPTSGGCGSGGGG